MLTASQLKEFRGRFAVFRDKIYLNSCSQGALSGSVREAVLNYLSSWDAAGSPWDVWVEEYEKARKTFAQFIGAQADEVAILPSASAGINSIASALTFEQRNRVVMGEFEFPTMGHIWLAQWGRGAEIHFIEAAGGALPAERYAAAIDKRTLVVPVTGLCFMNGWRSEVKKIASIARANGALVLLDDYQDCGTRPVDVKDLGVDVYVSGTLKYLLGPPGAAFMYVRPELQERLAPTISGWFAQRNPFAFDVKHLELSPTARRFEAGTPPIPNLYAAKAGVEMLQSIGMAAVAGHISDLTRQLADGTHKLGIQRKTPPDSVGPLTVLRCKDSEGLVSRLAERNIVVSNRHDGLRISFHAYNSSEDVAALVQALTDNRELLV